jgi:biopolymer transport protein ExbB
MNTWQQLVTNPVIWLIIMISLISYTLLFELLFEQKKDGAWLCRVNSWLDTLKVILNCLPLLGLFGTIIGLLSTFSQMSLGGMDQQELLSSGVSDAMLTTQVALLMFIPGWLTLAYLKKKKAYQEIKSSIISQENIAPNKTADFLLQNQTNCEIKSLPISKDNEVTREKYAL